MPEIVSGRLHTLQSCVKAPVRRLAFVLAVAASATCVSLVGASASYAFGQPVNVSPPTITGVAQKTDTLTEAHGSWTNSPTGYAYQWYRCNSSGASCAAISGATSQTYVLVSADVGSTLRVWETASNMFGSSSAAESQATAVVLPSVPSPVSEPSISGVVQQGKTLSEAHASWTNEPSSYTYQWLLCNASGASCAAIVGATSQSFVPVAADVGGTLRMEETASNAGGSSSPAYSEATAVVLPAAPTVVSVPAVSGVAQAGKTLTEVHGSWANEPSSYSYQWLLCNASGASCAAIVGATSQSFVPVAADVGGTLRMEEVASNAGGSSSPAYSEATAVVLPAAPTVVSVPAVSGVAQAGKTLTEVHGSWANEPSSYSYQWLLCNASGASCAAIVGATSQSFVPVAADVGGTLRMEEAASNAGGSSSPAYSEATAVVLPAAPTVVSVPAVSGVAQAGKTLTEVHGSWANEPSSYSYQWLLCNASGASCAAIVGATSQSFVPVAADVGSTLRVWETASNAGGSSSPAVSEATPVVLPAAPTVVSVPAVSGVAQAGKTLTEVHGSWANEPSSYSYQWLLCNASGASCAAIVGATSQSFVPVAADVGGTLRVEEVASNAGGSSSPAVSEATDVVAAATVLGAAPEAPTDPPATTTRVRHAPRLRPSRVVVAIKSVTLTKSGVVSIPLRCPASATNGCRGTIRITLFEPRAKRAMAVVARCARGCRTLGGSSYEARAGQKINVRMHIASFARRLVHSRKRLSVTLTATTFAGGLTATVTRRIAIKA